MRLAGIGPADTSRHLGSHATRAAPSRLHLSHAHWAIWALVAIIALLALARPVHGQVWVDANQLNGKLPDWVDPDYVTVPPAHTEPRVVVVPVEPRSPERRVYRRWVEPIVRVVYERVWIAPRYEWRDVISWDCSGRVIRRELVCVEPGHWDMCRHEIVVRPGYWEEVPILYEDGNTR